MAGNVNRGRVHVPILGLAFALALAACSDDPTSPPPIPIEETEFADELGIDLDQMTRLESGVYIQDIVVGEGLAPAEGDSVWVHYKLWLPDGFLVEDSREGGNEEPVRLLFRPLPLGPLIPGWVEGVKGMREGGTRKLVIPSELGYGEYGVRDSRGNFVIPPNANLVFEVELVQVKQPTDG
jgi:FKBP-type peptidyl-prolyl cis-trans isomerase FkpA